MRRLTTGLLGVTIALAGCARDPALATASANTAMTGETHSFFPIGHDTKHAGTDCNVCHGDFNSFTQFSCTSGCHAQAPCDAGHPGIADYLYTSGACLGCHPGGTADGSFASHPFPISATAVHTGIACKACHTVAGDYAQFSCTTGCHNADATDPIHTGLAGYAYASASCLACHPAGIAEGGAEHTRFPIGTGTSHKLGCSQCHKSTTARTDVTTLDCASCHNLRNSIGQHATVAGFVNTSDKCVACHADDQVDKVSAHTQFPIAFGKATHDTLCLDCHNTRRTDKTYAADFKASDCLTCHAQHPNVTQAALAAGHVAATGYVYTSAACLACHPAGTGLAPADHPTVFPIDAGTSHAAIGCTECHTDLAHPSGAANFKCATCHAAIDATLLTRHTANATSSIHVSSKEISLTDARTCLRCHAGSHVDHTVDHPKQSQIHLCSSNAGAPPHHGAGCTSCHSSYRTDQPDAAYFGTTGASGPSGTPPGCAQCHGNGQLCP